MALFTKISSTLHRRFTVRGNTPNLTWLWRGAAIEGSRTHAIAPGPTPPAHQLIPKRRTSLRAAQNGNAASRPGRGVTDNRNDADHPDMIGFSVEEATHIFDSDAFGVFDAGGIRTLEAKSLDARKGSHGARSGHTVAGRMAKQVWHSEQFSG